MKKFQEGEAGEDEEEEEEEEAGWTNKPGETAYEK